ncbi:uncharacterized protein LOC135396094 isoform X2 [Ornithodoros turicata]|uniref:uncharacterized protein LOC135396094 isoform X2 n=1 Tax=Ornithodoros turicata TaxID=34597 RepID=UPI00313A1246
MKYMTTCCCSCCTVETGTKILSILGAISFIIGFCSSITQTVFNNENNPFDLREIAVSQAVFCAIGALLAVLCMMGAVKKQRHLIFPYLVFQGIYMAYMVVFSTFLILAMGALGVSHHDAVGNDPKTMDSQTDSSRTGRFSVHSPITAVQQIVCDLSRIAITQERIGALGRGRRFYGRCTHIWRYLLQSLWLCTLS